MMAVGLTFQPGVSSNEATPFPKKAQPGSGVQEAIKVLSLRLPKVVGAQGIAPQALLQSPGSANSRVDAVVNRVLGRILPGAGAGGPGSETGASGAPMVQMPPGAPSFGGTPIPPTTPLSSWMPPSAIPRIIPGDANDRPVTVTPTEPTPTGPPGGRTDLGPSPAPSPAPEPTPSSPDPSFSPPDLAPGFRELMEMLRKQGAPAMPRYGEDQSPGPSGAPWAR